MATSGPPLPSSFDNDTEFYEESRWQKLKRRIVEEPLIPLGCVLTCAALFGASRSMRSGDKERTQIMFRRRIYAQAFTLVAMVAGSMYWKEDRNKRKEFEGVIADNKRVEKRDAWLRELEIRDQEEKEVKARMTRARERKIERELAQKSKGGSQQEPLIKLPEQKKGVVEAVQDKAAEVIGKGENPKSVFEACEDRSILRAVRSLSWKR